MQVISRYMLSLYSWLSVDKKRHASPSLLWVYVDLEAPEQSSTPLKTEEV